MDQYKARLVAEGYTQTYYMDYFETFLLVALLNSIRILFFITVNMSWPLFQLDVKNAFFYVAKGENKICRLRKIIYGLK